MPNITLYLLKVRNNILSPSYSFQLGPCWTLLSGHRVIWLHHYIYGTQFSFEMLCRTPQAKTMLQTFSGVYSRVPPADARQSHLALINPMERSTVARARTCALLYRIEVLYRHRGLLKEPDLPLQISDELMTSPSPVKLIICCTARPH